MYNKYPFEQPMISVVLFTYKRIDRLKKALSTMLSNRSIGEVLIFNDDETRKLTLSDIAPFDTKIPALKLFNTSDFGFTGRAFRKHLYMNKSIELTAHETIFFSDDDARFSTQAIDLHDKALERFQFCAGSIIRDPLFGRVSKTILQGTNYSFHKSFFTALGGYDESFVESMGGGDVDFWFRIYQYAIQHSIPVAYLPEAIQTVTGKSTRRNVQRTLDPKTYFISKHKISFKRSHVKWFPEIRDKKKWMTVLSKSELL
ncbi:MAG: hypothetical protein U5K79_07055 [Cyclobacteriaceae bacterium]|nr:hypothetical protein [Cyclobacteriaceae bacterium]